MKRQTVYRLFCVLGILLPYWQFVPWVVAQRGVPLGVFFRELFANRISGFFGIVVLVFSRGADLFRPAPRLPAGHASSLAADCGHAGRRRVVGLSGVSLPARRRPGKRWNCDGCSRIRQNLS